jgi:hypothetical protein
VRVAIVCDSRPEAGRGHVSRMTAMLEEGKRRGHEFYRISITEDIGTIVYNIVIVDDYRPDAFSLVHLSRLGAIVLFDDWQPERVTDAVALVVSPGGRSEDYSRPTLAGFDCAPLRSREDLVHCGVDWQHGMVTHGGQTSLEAAFMGYRQVIIPQCANVAGNVRRLRAGERPDGLGAARVWDAIVRL